MQAREEQRRRRWRRSGVGENVRGKKTRIMEEGRRDGGGREKGDVGGGQIATSRKRRRQSIAPTPASCRVRCRGFAIAHRVHLFSFPLSLSSFEGEERRSSSSSSAFRSLLLLFPLCLLIYIYIYISLTLSTLCCRHFPFASWLCKRSSLHLQVFVPLRPRGCVQEEEEDAAMVCMRTL